MQLRVPVRAREDHRENCEHATINCSNDTGNSIGVIGWTTTWAYLTVACRVFSAHRKISVQIRMIMILYKVTSIVLAW